MEMKGLRLAKKMLRKKKNKYQTMWNTRDQDVQKYIC